MTISEHTKLVNRVIGLCKDTAGWPSVLHNLGYEVQLIEWSISLLKSSQKITPDVVAVSKSLLHAIVIDCKSGTNIDLNQDNRYKSLEAHDLTYHVTVHDYNQLTHVVCYADVAANHVHLEQHTGLPFITFGPEEVCGKRNFGKSEVNDKLCKGVSLKNMLEPTGYYPFSPDDKDSAVIPHVLSGLLAYLVQRGRKSSPTTVDADIAEAILKNIHPFHERMSSMHRKTLTKRIKRIINLCKNNNAEFKQQLGKIDEGMDSSNTLQSLRRICEQLIDKELVDEYAQQTTIDTFIMPSDEGHLDN